MANIYKKNTQMSVMSEKDKEIKLIYNYFKKIKIRYNIFWGTPFFKTA